MRVRKYPKIERLGQKALRDLYYGAEARGFNLDDLLAQIWIESGFDPSVLTGAAKEHPEQTASGLLQWTDQAARYSFPALRDLPKGKAAAAVRQMSPDEQVPGIFTYYDAAKRPLSGAQFRLLGYSLSPAILTKPDSFVLYGKEAAELNPGANESGQITVGSVKREWQRLTANRDRFPMVEISSLPDEPANGEASGDASGIPGIAIALGLIWLIKKGKQ